MHKTAPPHARIAPMDPGADRTAKAVPGVVPS